MFIEVIVCNVSVVFWDTVYILHLALKNERMLHLFPDNAVGGPRKGASFFTYSVYHTFWWETIGHYVVDFCI